MNEHHKGKGKNEIKSWSNNYFTQPLIKTINVIMQGLALNVLVTHNCTYLNKIG